MWRKVFRGLRSVANQQKFLTIQQFPNARCHQEFTSTNTGNATDVLSTQLKTASSPSRIFELTETNIRAMNNDHLLNVLSLLHDMRRKSLTGDVLQEPAFRDICSRLLVKARFFDADQTLEVLKYLSSLGVPTESAVFQAYLQMMRFNVNDLTVAQVIFLNFLLQKQSPTKLVLALKKAVPLVAENILNYQLTSCGQSDAVQLYLLAAQTGLRPETLRTVAEYITDSVGPLTPENSTFILWALTKQNSWDDLSFELLEMSSAALTASTGTLDMTVLRHCIKRLKDSRMYNEGFFDAVTVRALEEKWDIKDSQNLVEMLAYHKFLHVKFLDYYAELVERDLEINGSDVPLRVLTEVFASLCYKPKNWDAIFNLIRRDELISRLQMDEKDLLRLAVNLAVLGPVPNRILNTAFETCTEGINQNGSCRGFEDDLRLLWHSADETQKIMFRNAGEIILKLNGPDKREYNVSVNSALNKAYGANYVNSGVRTTTGFTLDHVIVFDSKARPVSIDSFDYSPHAGLVKVVVLEKSHVDYLNNTQLPTGKSVLKDDILRKLGFQPVPILMESWLNFPERERIPYLQRAIQSVLKISDTNYVTT